MADPKDLPPRKSLAEVVADAELIGADELESAIELQRRSGRKLEHILTEQGLIGAEDLAAVRSIQLHIPLIDLKRHKVQPDALALVPERLARKHNVLPLDIVNDCLLVVMADPEDSQAMHELATETMMPIMPAMGIPSQVQKAISLNYKVSSEIEEQISRIVPQVIEERVEADMLRESVAEAPTVRAVDLLVKQAVKDRASDIHIEPQKYRLRIRYRIDGILHDVASLPMRAHPSLVSRIKVLAQLDIAERRRPQDGQFSVEFDGKEIDIRTATFGTIYGEMAVLRILDKSLPLFELTELGLSADALERYQRMLRSPWGMIAITGPTGSGKTTTLYASINQMDRNERNIITVEDPVEYAFNDINPSEINPKADITFASGLRSILRLDPDIILIGEMRDEETAEIAVQAALTGHLVLSSIHANDAVGAIFRFMHLGIEPFLLSSALLGIVAQRMVRRVCPYCRQLRQPIDEEKLAYQQEMGELPTHLYYGAGCNFCAETGFLGRTGVFEVLPVTEEIRGLILRGASSDEIHAQAIKEGMMTMRHDGMLKVREGITTPGEVLRNVFSVGNDGQREPNRSIDEEPHGPKAGEPTKSIEVLDEVLPAGQNERDENTDREPRGPKAGEPTKSIEVLDEVLPAGRDVESERNASIDGELDGPKVWQTIESLLPGSHSLETYVGEHMPEAAADLVPISIRNLPELVWATILYLQGKHPKLDSTAQVTLALIEVGSPVLTQMVKGIPPFKALMDRAYLEGDESQRLELLKNQFEVRISASKLNKTVYCLSKETFFQLNELADDLGLGRPIMATLALVAGMAQSLFWVPGKHQNKALEEIREFEKWVERRRTIV